MRSNISYSEYFSNHLPNKMLKNMTADYFNQQIVEIVLPNISSQMLRKMFNLKSIT